ncbi:hypothetical protein F2Q69_00032507 [Brassica cretica]|uniref:Uncharacterized protein n=1 Tax=Brassica cretica TaxID=69181 RepID=A0A8S9RWD3_BRACR|nr:hypothetical protein F2Q69_00032507 [Brassica cretica]
MGKSTPETVKLHPVRELTELCQKAQFELSKAKGFENGEALTSRLRWKLRK